MMIRMHLQLGDAEKIKGYCTRFRTGIAWVDSATHAFSAPGLGQGLSTGVAGRGLGDPLAGRPKGEIELVHAYQAIFLVGLFAGCLGVNWMWQVSREMW